VWYDWPGNVRQLENILKRFLILCDRDIVSELREVAGSAGMQPPNPARSLKQVGEHAAHEAEKAVALDTLQETGWNRKESARLLQISYRAFRTRLKKWQLSNRRHAKARAVGTT